MEKILVSACLLGVACKYSGGHNRCEAICRAAADPGRALIPVCPEQMGGLPTPRPPAERRGEKVFSQTGADVTEAFRRGAQQALDLARLNGCRTAILKERSPSCGCGTIYDGSFSSRLTSGDGVTAALLQKNGIRVLGESQAAAYLAVPACTQKGETR